MYYTGDQFKSICVFFPHGIGDVVMASPIIIGLKRKYPNASITTVLRSSVEYQLLGGDTSVHELIIWDIHKKHTFKEKLVFIRSLRKRKFDLLVFDHGIDGFKSAVFSFLIAPAISVGEKESFISKLFTHTSQPDYSAHKVVNNWKILEALDIFEKSDPYVYYEESDKKFVQTILKENGFDLNNYLVIHPGSGVWEAHKRWPAETFKKLIHKLRENISTPIIFVGGQDERQLCDEIVADFNTDSLILNEAGKLSIRQLAVLLASSLLVIGADSGLMHIASAVGAKTLSLFGPTPVHWTAPYKNNKIISLNLPCSPCYFDKQFGCGNPICMSNISEALVFKEIIALINEKSMENISAV